MIAYLENLKYLDYEVIDAKKKERAVGKYQEEIADKDNSKAAEKSDE